VIVDNTKDGKNIINTSKLLLPATIGIYFGHSFIKNSVEVLSAITPRITTPVISPKVPITLKITKTNPLFFLFEYLAIKLIGKKLI